MEDSNIGNHCEFENCGKKDFFSFQCSTCEKYFCGDHRNKCPCFTLNAQTNPDKSQIQKVKNVCSYYKEKDGVKEFCQKEGHTVCGLCNLTFCIPHRFETDHDCAAFKQIEEAKKTDPNMLEKQAILEKIKERSNQEKKSDDPLTQIDSSKTEK